MRQRQAKNPLTDYRMLRRRCNLDFLIALLAALAIQSNAFLPTSRSRTASSPRFLFFKATDAPQKPVCKIPDHVFTDFASKNVTLPYQCQIKTAEKSRRLTIRFMQSQDLQRISDMCYAEYSTGPATLSNFPWRDPTKIEDWMERLLLRPLVDLTMRLKQQNDNSTRGPNDYAVIVACLDDTICGMVEVNRQPILPDRNPPPYPIPLFLKRIYCQITQVDEGAWIANLLVAPEFRGWGVGKVLVSACESVARSSLWKCQSIHLHCDADSVSGHIPQKLYESMGYQRVPDPNPDYAWMPMMSSSVYVIDGVPLLYLRKKL